MSFQRHIVTLGFAAFAVAVAAFTASAAAGPLEDQLSQMRARKGSVGRQIDSSDRRVQSMQRQVATLSQRIQRLNVPIASLDGQISDLQSIIDHRQARIAELQAEYRAQRTQIQQLSAEIDVARQRLIERVVAAYRGNQTAMGLGSWVVGAQDFDELLQRREALSTLTRSDRDLLGSIELMQRKVRIARAHNHERQAELAAEARKVDADQARLEQSRAQLLAQRSEVAAIRVRRARVMQELQRKVADLHDDYDRLESDVDTLREVIAGGGQFSGAVPPGLSSSGLIWPVSGPVVSGFGWRWGRMHEGLDISVGIGVPIHAAAAGVVIHSGWQDGYGNLVVVQHAGSLATAYGHQSRINVGVGQVVLQGQVIGFVGCTGRCFGPHVHFETRVNGSAVDPMGYL